MREHIEVLAVDMNEFDSLATYKKGAADFYKMFGLVEDEDEALLAKKVWEDADETGSDEMRYYLVVEHYDWDAGREYWQEIHTDLYLVNDERGAA